MGYIEDLRDKRLEEFSEQLIAKKAENPEEYLFQLDFSAYTFSCRFKEGFTLIGSLTKLISSMKKWVKLSDKRLKAVYEKFETVIIKDDKTPDSLKKETLKEAKTIFKNVNKEEKEKLNKIRHIRNDLILRTCNIFIYIISIALSALFGYVLYTFNNAVVKSIIYPLSALAIILFIALQILYIVKYLKAIKANKQATILFCTKRAYSASLVVWWYFAILTIINCWNVAITTYSFAAIFVLYVIFMIYDLFLSSSLFDELESSLSLIAAIIIGLFAFTDSFGNQVATQVGSIFLLLACLVLTLLIIKKFFLEKKNVSNFLEIFYVVLIILTTIILTIVALYKLLWITPTEGQAADNTLFSAVVGVYAAILGGGLTLAGVAWTIKKNEEDKNHERALLEKDRQSEERKKFIPYLKHVTEIPENSSVVQSYEWTVNRFNIEIDDERVIKNDNKLFGIGINSFFVKNISNNNVVLVGVRVNGELFKFVGDLVAESKEYVYFNLKTSYTIDSLQPISSIQIICSDILGNIYSFDCKIIIFSQHNETRQKGDKSLVIPCLVYDITEIGLPQPEASAKL